MKIKYYKIDDSDNPGIAKVEVTSVDRKFLGVFNIKILEIVRPSEFASCKIGQKRKVIGRLLFDTPYLL